MKKMSRRDFLRLSSITAAGTLLAACTPQVVEKTIQVTKEVIKEVEVPKEVIVTQMVEVTPTPQPFQTFPDGTKLTMKLRAAFVPQANDILRSIVKDWGNRANVEVEVDIVSMNDLQTIAATAAETGAGPDIIEINQGSAHLFAEKLVDVSDVAEDLGNRYGGWYDSAIEACNVDGKWLALPRFYAAHAINYRQDIFEQVGVTTPPKTWEEVYEIGKKLKEAQLPPIAFPVAHAVGDGNDFAYSILWSFGASDVAADGKTVAIDSPETRAALEWMQKMFNEVMPPDVLSYDDAANNRAFAAGAISCTNNAATIWANAINQGTKIKVGEEEILLHTVTNHFPYPAGPKGTVTYAEFMASAVFAYSKSVDAAKALLTYLNEEAQYSPWAMPLQSFAFPPLKAMADLPLMPWNTNPKLAPFKIYSSQSHLPGYPSTNFRAGTDAYAKWLVVDLFANVCSGAKTIDEAIAEASDQLKTIYS